MLPMKQGKLIVIDGTDGSGKTTQWKNLCRRFKKEKIPYIAVDFPIYQSFFGKFIKRFLKGEFGDPTKIDSYFASLPYALDRFFYKEKIIKALNLGKLVIANRYATANFILQGAKILDREQRAQFFFWLERLEYKIFKIPRPDLVMYLWMPAEISQRLILERERKTKGRKKMDLHEKRFYYQKRAERISLELVEKYKNWKMVRCYEDGKLLSKQEIAKRVWEIVKCWLES